MILRDIIAGNISRYRKDLGLTQEALADKLGITFQAVSKWETGQTVPDTALLPKLAHILKLAWTNCWAMSLIVIRPASHIAMRQTVCLQERCRD